MKKLATVIGIIFVVAGLPKFVAHRWEVGNFTGMGFPHPELWVIAAGVIEIVGGALLIARRFVRGAAVALAATMVVAIAVSGILHHDVIPSLTLAPALLAACVYLAITPRERGAPA